MERLKMDFDSIDETINDLLDEFKHVPIKDIREALRGGGLGKYGRTHKLSTQEVCIWIREYIKENEIKIGKISLENFQKSSKYNGEY